MNWYKHNLEITTRGKGMTEITSLVADCISGWQAREGMCHLYVPHTSASLVISENHDPSARIDLEIFVEKIAPERMAWMRHTMEGDDDSPSHMRTIITGVDLSIPVEDGKLALGTWQGIYLFEHRAAGRRRQVLARCLAVD
jgi:secondary thiamine-phosphate synthase enzyme